MQPIDIYMLTARYQFIARPAGAVVIHIYVGSFQLLELHAMFLHVHKLSLILKLKMAGPIYGLLR
jgi:hypothetical protein